MAPRAAHAASPRRYPFAALAVAFLLAGCAGPRDDDAPTQMPDGPGSARTVHPAAATPGPDANAPNGSSAKPKPSIPVPIDQFTAPDCIGQAIQMLMPETATNDLVPPAYAESEPVNAHLYAFTCPTVTLGNVTEHDVSVAYAGYSASQDSASGVITFYEFELFIDEPAPNAMQAAFEARGFRVTPADIAVGDLALEVAASNITYAVTFAAPHAAHMPPGSGQRIVVMQGIDGQVQGYNDTVRTSMVTGGGFYNSPDASLLDARGGAFGHVQAEMGGLLVPGTNNSMRSDFDVDFVP